MAARRCDIGCESWPDAAIFNFCSYCGEPTTRVNNINPTISLEEAKSIKLHELFEKFYEKRCAEKGIPAEGPLPEPGPLDLDTLGPAPKRA